MSESEQENRLELPELEMLEAELKREEYRNSFGRVL